MGWYLASLIPMLTVTRTAKIPRLVTMKVKTMDSVKMMVTCLAR
jgi:hypothetical protein